MQYQVPQFIEIEDKIFGPLGFRQFIYLAGGAGIAAILITFLPLFFGIILSIPFVGLSMALAFYKINNKPFIEIIEYGFFYFMRDKLYLWKKRDAAIEQRKDVRTVTPPQKPTQNPLDSEAALQKIHDLAWTLDVKDPNQNYGN